MILKNLHFIADFLFCDMNCNKPMVGLEPTTYRLRSDCSAIELHRQKSGEPDSNRRPSAWEADVLPLNYRRKIYYVYFILFVANFQYFCYDWFVWPHRLVVRTPDFQSDNGSSILPGAVD